MAIRNDAGLMFFFYTFFLFGERRGENVQWMVETGRHGEAGRLFHWG